MNHPFLPFLILSSLGLVSVAHGSDSNETVCGNIDIRNNVNNLIKLSNCTVIEGYLQIVLIDNGTAKAYENFSFPKLREITDYMLLFRASGLHSLEKLFPNLSVIRGRRLFHDYALVVYEMLQLQQLTLKNLTTIVRGAVRIEKNPNLCYVETIDWDRIAKSGKENHFIQANKPFNECPKCGSDCRVLGPPKRGNENIKEVHYGDKNGRLCWNSHTCQKVCSSHCELKNLSCNNFDTCCDRNCLGGCSAENPNKCVACAGVIYNNTCMKECPDGLYEYLERRCVNETECISLSQKYYEKKQNSMYLKPVNKKCTPECPPNYVEDKKDKYKCTVCKGRCPKECPSAQVTNIASAQALKGCTVINGSLEIYLQGGGENIVAELEKSLSDIEEIKGFLKIARSHALLSLNFLKKLHLIHGNVLERGMYSFLVIDNPNLQHLWVWEEKNNSDSDYKMKISKGKIFFHINPKLCYSNIEKLKKYVEMPEMSAEWEDKDVSLHSNGDKVPCEVSKLNVSLWRLSSEIVGIRFTNFKKHMEDQRSLLGYLIYYKETKFNNVTIFDGRDACETDDWQVDDFEETGDDENCTHIIPRLKPFTQYALYIRTYTIASERKGALSDIIYFVTKADTPSQPRSLVSHPLTTSEILIEWEMPKSPNGQLTHYVVAGSRVVDSSDYIAERNFCIDPAEKVTATSSAPILTEEKEPKKNIWLNDSKPNQQCCQCKKIDEAGVESRISFEDYLINAVYVKRQLVQDNSTERIDSKRKRRAILPGSEQQLLFQGNRTLNGDAMSLNTTTLPTTQSPHHLFFNYTVKFTGAAKQTFHVYNLTHFTEYTIRVIACQSNASSLYGTGKSLCSLEAITSIKTLPMEGADEIDENSIYVVPEVNSTKMVYVRWSEPPNPNGLIVSYSIEYKKVSSENINFQQSITPVCITALQYQQNKAGWPLIDLPPGNYSLRLRANSLAGWGSWTKPYYFNVIDTSELPQQWVWVIVLTSLIVCISFILLAGFIYVKYRKNQAILDYVSVNPEYISAGTYQLDPKWEVSREKVKIGKELGQGSFGMVYEGTLAKAKEIIKCAIKTVNENASQRDRIDFLNEADVMKSFVDCNHVVKLLGIVSSDQPVYVCMEIMEYGDLRSYLRSHRPDDENNPGVQPPTLHQFYQMAIEIADGMAYLASKKFVHRDLAARNCMVACDLTVKIGDFGMARDIYETDYYRKGGKGLLPVRWMAPESLKDGVFTTYSDVWSYGVVLWEMVTLASQPYQGLSNEHVLQYVLKKGTMQQPENCPPKLWSLMSSCWKFQPKSRPMFIELVEVLLSESNQKFRENSFYAEYRSQQLKQKSSASLEEVSIPLNAESDVNIEDDEQVNFFPSRVNAEDLFVSGGFDEEISKDDISTDSIDREDEYPKEPRCCPTQRNGKQNKCLTFQSDTLKTSEDSRESKVSSTTSNGSLANGHIKTTSC